MTRVMTQAPAAERPPALGGRANALAERLEQGARALEAAAVSLTDVQWQIRIPKDGRTIGVVVHHVASMYPLEMQLVETLAAGTPITGVTWAVIDDINARHASEHANVTRTEAIELLRRNSAAAAAGVRALSDEALDRAATISLNADAPLTCQFFLEDHPLRHSYHHLAKIREALAAAHEGLAMVTVLTCDGALRADRPVV